ncbi:MAG TPA: hypothetical protein VGH15_06550 [Caulobacteraceae bacterium]|jgi:hypothetical protein
MLRMPLAASALIVLSACGRSAAPGAAEAAVPARGACDKSPITQADMAPILREAITSVRPLEGDPQSCVFTTATFTSVTVAIRPGLGKATISDWAAGRMPLSASPLDGVGDRALWQPTLHEVIAEKADLLCDIGAAGPPEATRAATPQRLGALCNRIFAVGGPSS